MVRHFVYFDQRVVPIRCDTGRTRDLCPYLREWKGECGEPDVDPVLPELERRPRLDAWATRVARPQMNEVALDVTDFDYPEGDFVWWVFDPVDRRLDWPNLHTFLEIETTTMTIVANTRSSRPVRSHGTRLLLDVTGTWAEALYGALFGRFVQVPEGCGFEPSLALPSGMQRQLTEAVPDLFAWSVRQAAGVPVLRTQQEAER
jgi:hypothetical protein